MPTPNSGDTERVGTGRERAGGDGAHEPGGEFDAVARIGAELADPALRPRPGETWMGDDTAVLDPPRGRMLFTVDAVVAGVHVDLRLASPADAGYKAMVASLSDIAAMGGRPCHAVAAVAGPPDTDLVGLARGMKEAAVGFGCPLVGGNLSQAGVLSVTIAVTGEVAEGPPPVPRSGSRPGDALCVTGALGASAAGLRLLRTGASGPAALVDAHRRPRPHLAEGETARLAGAHAMIDVSDGLAADLGRLADASGVGFNLDHLPVADGATDDEALGGGEDYVLVVAVADPDALAAAFSARGLEPPLQLGRCVADPAERTLHGETIVGGWEHDFRN